MCPWCCYFVPILSVHGFTSFGARFLHLEIYILVSNNTNIVALVRGLVSMLAFRLTGTAFMSPLFYSHSNNRISEIYPQQYPELS